MDTEQPTHDTADDAEPSLSGMGVGCAEALSYRLHATRAQWPVRLLTEGRPTRMTTGLPLHGEARYVPGPVIPAFRAS